MRPPRMTLSDYYDMIREQAGDREWWEGVDFGEDGDDPDDY